MHAKKEDLSLWTPPHSVHPPNTSRGMIFSLLKTYHSHSSNKINYVMKVNKLLNDLLERGYNQTTFLDVFKKAQMELM